MATIRAGAQHMHHVFAGMAISRIIHQIIDIIPDVDVRVLTDSLCNSDFKSTDDLVIFLQNEEDRTLYRDGCDPFNPRVTRVMDSISYLRVIARCRKNGKVWDFRTDRIDHNMIQDIAGHIVDSDMVALYECPVCMEHLEPNMFTMHFYCTVNSHRTCDDCVVSMFDTWVSRLKLQRRWQHVHVYQCPSTLLCPCCRAYPNDIVLMSDEFDIRAKGEFVIVSHIGDEIE